MMTETSPSGTAAPTVFSRVLVGVDGSPESLEAARQAGRLLDVAGELRLLAAFDIAPALVGGTGPGVPAYYDDETQRTIAEAALTAAREQVGEFVATSLVARGNPWQELLHEARNEPTTLIAVGSHGTGRAKGILIGSTATELVHKASCSVLVARKAGSDFPRRIVIGVDGSPESAAAFVVAKGLADRLGAELWPLVAHGGKDVDRAAVAKIVDYHHEDQEGEAVPSLVAAAADADLLVVGSRGLHGLRSLGSVSERVAHQARSSVLIVRRGDDADSSG